MDVKRLTAVFEDAAFHPGEDALSKACEVARTLVEANTAYFVRMDVPPSFIGDARIHDIMRTYFSEDWWRIDERSYATRAEQALGVRIDDDIISAETRKHSPFLNEFSRDFDIPYSAGLGFVLGGEHWAFAALRGESAGRFTEQERAELAQLLPVVKRAAEFSLVFKNSRAQGIAQGLEASGMAAIVLDHRGLCMHITARAEALFDADFGVVGGRLRAADRLTSAGLAQLEALAQARAPTCLPPPVIAPRRDGRRPILITAMRVAGAGLDRLPGARVIVTLADLDARPRPRADLIQRAFKLTAREAQIADEIGAGRSVEQVTEHLALRASTVRQLLKSVFQKTGASRQAELVALLARLPPP